jgi:uncharacterized membrane protein YdjX (TVP38/TMEM64 family)
VIGAGSPRPRWASIATIALAALGITLLVVTGRTAGASIMAFATWVEGLGAWGPAAFIAGYIVACVAFVPGAVLTLAAGVLFGLTRGVLYVFIASTLGSAAAFLVSRYLARAEIERRLAGNARFAAIDQAIAREGLKIVLLLRLSPVFPFNLLNYGLGLTQVRFVDYVIASIGTLPGTVLYVYYGTAIGSLARLAAGARPPGGTAGAVFLGLGLVATVAVTLLVTRIARRALQRATAVGSGSDTGSGRGAGSRGEV